MVGTIIEILVEILIEIDIEQNCEGFIWDLSFSFEPGVVNARWADF